MFGQYNLSYYQPQLANYNQRQKYIHDRRTQQAPSRNDYDRDKVVKHGNINNGIPPPDQKIPIIPLGNDSYARRKNQLILLRLP